jgi:hypothetical protein
MAGCGTNCVTDSAYVQAAEKQAKAIAAQAAADIAIQVGIALWQRNSSQSISNMQTNLANQQVELAERVHAHAVLFWPEEAELVNDIFGEARTTPVYDLGTGWGEIANQTLADARLVWLDTSRAECFAPDRCDDARWQRNAALNEVDMTSYGYRQAEARSEILNDRRYARQLAALGMSRGSLKSLLSYQDVGQTSGLYAATALTEGVNNVLDAYGYYAERSLSAPEPWAAGARSSIGTTARMGGTVQTVQTAQSRRSEATTFGIPDSAAGTVSQLPPVAPVQRRARPGKAGESDQYLIDRGRYDLL